MDIAIQLGIILILILVNAFFAAAEISVVSLNPLRVQTLAEQGDRRAKLIQKITQDSTRFLATIQVGITLAGFFTSATAASQLSLPITHLLTPVIGNVAQSLSLIIVTLIIAFISLVFGELVPKRVGLRNAEAIALSSVPIIHWVEKLARPVVRFLSFVTNGILHLIGQGMDDEATIVHIEEIKALVEAARLGGTVGPQEERIIRGAVELKHLTARAIMVPRVQIQYVNLGDSLEDVLKISAEFSHTRLPVCQGDLDNIVGILHAKDLVGVSPTGEEHVPRVRELLRPVQFILETKPLTDLLREMKTNRLHMVVVQDEFGGTAGLITLEDVLEEIVGEIRDEYDAAEERAFERLNDSGGIFNLREGIATVNHELNIHLPRDEVASVQGLFLQEFDRIPEPGDRLEIENVTLEVLQEGLKVKIVKDKHEEDAEDA